MNDKKYVIGFVGIILAVLIGIGITNYVVDPFGYFHFTGGNYDKIDFDIAETQYVRYLKAQHIKNYGNRYDAFFIGGSKAGSYKTEDLSRLDGYKYYNVSFTQGNFTDYVRYVEYILEHTTNTKKIVLNISGGEVNGAVEEQQGDMAKVPAMVSGESETAEYFDFLFKDVTYSIDKLQEEEKVQYSNYATGERNLQKYYDRRDTNPDAFIKKYVTKEYDEHVERLFTRNRRSKNYAYNIECLEKIKNMCDKRGVELLVIIAPSFIGEMSEFESAHYWDYLAQIVNITDVWDFSGFNDINLNPYNYYNEGHYLYEVVELMMNTIIGKDSYDGFGTYVTQENLYEYLQERRETYNKYKAEYIENGTIELFGYDHESMVCKG